MKPSQSTWLSSCCCKSYSDIDIENDEDIRMEIRRKHFGWEVVADILAAREEVQDVICVAGLGGECFQLLASCLFLTTCPEPSTYSFGNYVYLRENVITSCLCTGLPFLYDIL